METPKLSIEKVMKGEKPAIRLVVRYATPELRAKLDSLGVLPVADIFNCRAIVCATPAELDAVRNPLAPLFDRQGQWLGKEVV